MEDSIVSYHELKKLVAIKFEKANIPHDHAETVAEVLVHADLRNVHSHGVMRTKQYIERIIGRNK